MCEAPFLFVLGSFVVACSAKVPHLPAPGESLCASAFTVEAGGKGLNLAVGAHRLGAKVDGLFAIGEDYFSQLAEPALTRAGLSPTMVRRYPSMTGSGIGFTDDKGENCLAVYPGANLLLTGQDVLSVTDAIRGSSLVLAQFEIADEPILEAFKLARQAGIRTLLNPSPYRALDRRLLQQTSVLVVNTVEATQLAEQYLPEGISPGNGAAPNRYDSLANSIMQHGPDTLIITLGKQGALAYQHGKQVHHQPAFVVDAIDSLGAGDAFTAGLATSLLEGSSLPEALARGAAAGAITTERIGVFGALPTRIELESFLSTRA